jgi:hypothetical protein
MLDYLSFLLIIVGSFFIEAPYPPLYPPLRKGDFKGQDSLSQRVQTGFNNFQIIL